jgi:hypothetical protein
LRCQNLFLKDAFSEEYLAVVAGFLWCFGRPTPAPWACFELFELGHALAIPLARYSPIDISKALIKNLVIVNG